MVKPFVAVTGRRLGRKQSTWPYSRGLALPHQYFDAVRRAGGVPLMVDPAPSETRYDLERLLARVDALVLSGGPDVDPAGYGEEPHTETYGVDRDADDFESALVQLAMERRTRTLAICRGAQVVNVAFGGTLYQHIPDDPGVAAHGRPGEANGQLEHDVKLDAGSRLRDVMGVDVARASCHHHQAIAETGAGLQVVARAADGIVEALEAPGLPLLAVQWHPEDTAADDPAQQRLFDWLVQ
jgi:putative glutamine amidotransferase